MSNQNLPRKIDRKINKIIVHCSASEWGDAEVIDSWHRDRGFKCIGYHDVILNGLRAYEGVYEPNQDGVIEHGRGYAEIGAHCKGYNEDSIGICLIGMRFFTLEQFRVLIGHIGDLMQRFPNVDLGSVYGHGEINPGKECPTFDMNFIRSIVQHVKEGR